MAPSPPFSLTSDKLRISWKLLGSLYAASVPSYWGNLLGTHWAASMSYLSSGFKPAHISLRSSLKPLVSTPMQTWAFLSCTKGSNEFIPSPCFIDPLRIFRSSKARSPAGTKKYSLQPFPFSDMHELPNLSSQGTVILGPLGPCSALTAAYIRGNLASSCFLAGREMNKHRLWLCFLRPYAFPIWSELQVLL